MYYRCYSCHRDVPADDVLYPLPRVGSCLCYRCNRDQVRAMEEEMRRATAEPMRSLQAPLV